MSASLVGSEMCIRDRCSTALQAAARLSDNARPRKSNASTSTNLATYHGQSLEQSKGATISEGFRAPAVLMRPRACHYCSYLADRPHSCPFSSSWRLSWSRPP
eukprot:4805126-Alexandrium_andersonii.AAC.1